MVTLEVFDSVLPFAVDRLMKILHDSGAGRFRSREVRINIADEHGEALSLAAGLGRTRATASNSTDATSCSVRRVVDRGRGRSLPDHGTSQ